MENKQYLGDGVYVEHDEQGMLTLSVQNAGEAFEHSIHLEPEVYAALVAYVARMPTQRRLAAVAESMTEHAYQEMASALEVDACRVGPREASAVAALRAILPMIADPTCDNPGCLGCLAYANARRVLAAAGPDPMPVVRAAMRYLDHGDDGRLGSAWVGFREAVDAYRKAGGK